MLSHILQRWLEPLVRKALYKCSPFTVYLTLGRGPEWSSSHHVLPRTMVFLPLRRSSSPCGLPPYECGLPHPMVFLPLSVLLRTLWPSSSLSSLPHPVPSLCSSAAQQDVLPVPRPPLQEDEAQVEDHQCHAAGRVRLRAAGRGECRRRSPWSVCDALQ